MPFSVKKDTITLPTVAGSVVVSGLSFQPKALILWSTKQTATGIAADAIQSVGMATSSSARYCVQQYSTDALAGASSTTVHRQENTLCLVPQTTVGGTNEVTLDLASFNSDGFTLTLATPSGTPVATIVHYMALGGSDLTNAFVFSPTPGAGTGDKAFTGVGFRPECVITMQTMLTGFGSAFSTGQVHVGAFTSAAAFTTNWKAINAANPSDVSQWQIAKVLNATTNATGSTQDHDATFVSFDSDGFTLNYGTNVSNHPAGFLCLKGGRYSVHTETQKTSTGTQAKTGIGFTPKGLFLAGASAAANAAIDQTQAKQVIGGSDGTTEGCTFVSVTDNVATSEAKSSASTSKFLQHITNPSTVNAEASGFSLDADGYTLDWTTADVTAREFAVVAFGSPATGGGGTPTPQQADLFVNLAGTRKKVVNFFYTRARVVNTPPVVAPIANQTQVATNLAANLRRRNTTYFLRRPVSVGDPVTPPDPSECPVLTPEDPSAVSISGEAPGSLSLSGEASSSLDLTPEDPC